MSNIMPGRYAATVDGPFVVFIIGMRVNRIFAVRKWVPTAIAMGPMLKTLFQHPEKGFLGAETFLSWRGTGIVQYWRSFDDLERFARSKEEPHLSAWKRFNKAVGTDGSVGIWHETYQVAAGQYEAVYNNMPVYGLAKATTSAPATGRHETARRRMGGESEPAVPTPA
jgi:Domain of unknown function (DUF4188)